MKPFQRSLKVCQLGILIIMSTSQHFLFFRYIKIFHPSFLSFFLSSLNHFPFCSPAPPLFFCLGQSLFLFFYPLLTVFPNKALTLTHISCWDFSSLNLYTYLYSKCSPAITLKPKSCVVLHFHSLHSKVWKKIVAIALVTIIYR